MDLLGIGTLAAKVLDKVIPDAGARAAAQLELEKLKQTGELQTLQVEMSAILAEANSTDKWTSRSRPAFMYVMYVMILYAIPFSWIYAVKPDIAAQMVVGFKMCLDSIPKELYGLFGVGYLGYVGARSYDKSKGTV
jgi:hypothetical protein